MSFILVTLQFAQQVKSVQVFGQTLAVFRGSGGEAHVTDAYCPHIGANMGVGGVVKGDCLECPFHGWLFRGSDGKCVDIPYSSKGECDVVQCGKQWGGMRLMFHAVWSVGCMSGMIRGMRCVRWIVICCVS